jgi:hypothetical protein
MGIRRWLLLAGCACLMPVAAALAAAPSLPARFAEQIATIKRHRGAPPVLLPRGLPLGRHRLYATVSTVRGGYFLALGVVRGCGGVDACSVATFSGARGGTVDDLTPVHVAGASAATYHGLLCGGSCSPPAIDFIVHGDLYSIQANLSVPKTEDESTLVRAAEAAISAGPR